MSSIWLSPPDEAFAALAQAYHEQVRAGITAIAQRNAPLIQNWMKANAPWTDRTGNARQTLYTELQGLLTDMVAIILAHGVEYGIYLEMSNAGRYAIVGPALDEWGERLWQEVVSMMGG